MNYENRKLVLEQFEYLLKVNQIINTEEAAGNKKLVTHFKRRLKEWRILHGEYKVPGGTMLVCDTVSKLKYRGPFRNVGPLTTVNIKIKKNPKTGKLTQHW